MIRQAISCDICGTEKKQTNHWFVAYDQGGELRVSGWETRNRLRPGSKHLCGQTCLHKLVDDYITRALATRVHPAAVDDLEDEIPGNDRSLTAKAGFAEVESSARLLPSPASGLAKRSLLKTPSELVAMPPRADEPVRLQAVDPEPVAETLSRFTSRSWRSEAWEREREREMRAMERHREIASGGRGSS